MNLVVLKNELLTDPLARGYSGMTDQQAADDLNTVYRTRNRTSMTGREFKNQWDATEFSVLSESQQSLLYSLASRDDLDPFGIDATTVQGIFPGGGTTITALAAYRVEDISRGEELGIGTVSAANVDSARRATE
jgi:hypothetical protein